MMKSRFLSPRASRAARWLAALGCLFFSLMLAPLAANGQNVTPAEPPRYASGEIVLAWRPESNVIPVVPRTHALDRDRTSPERVKAVAALADLTGLAVLDAQLEYGFARLAVTPGREEVEIARLRQLPWVAFAEPNYIVRATGGGDAFYPTDPHFSTQWNMRRVAAPGAWAITQGSTTLVVAVIDSGLDLAHPEFPGWRVLPGWDYVRDDDTPNDENGHGTHVTGILTAATGNGQGISGLAPSVLIRPLKVLDQNGVGYGSDVAAALYEAMSYFQPPAQIFNLSLGDAAGSTLLQGAVASAQSKGALVVAAAGNCAQPVSECNYLANPSFYPAAYDGVLAVAASDRYDNWATYSGYKPYVGIAAPGGIQSDQIWSTALGGYGYKYGTSIAAPLVSAAAALVWTVEPAANAQDVANILKSTADKVEVRPFGGLVVPYVNGRNDYFGYGRLNVNKAVRWAYPPSLQPIVTKQTFLLGGPLTQAKRTLTLKNISSQTVTWQATVISGADWLSASPATGSANYLSPGELTLRAGPTALGPGLYTGTVRVEALYPGWLPSFDIPVELRVNAAIGQEFLPLTLRDRYAPDWYDPLAPGVIPTVLGVINNGLVTQALPFQVSFFDGFYSQVRVSENGLVIMGSGTGTLLAAPTECLPSAAAPNNALYPLALDWQLNLGGGVYAHQPDADTYVITWLQVRNVAGASPSSFQIVFRRSGPITVHYLAVAPSLSPIVGTENYDGTYASLLACNGVGRVPSSGDVLMQETVYPW